DPAPCRASPRASGWRHTAHKTVSQDGLYAGCGATSSRDAVGAGHRRAFLVVESSARSPLGQHARRSTMRTAIFTTAKTALTIQTTETLQLVQMSSPALTSVPINVKLTSGTNQVTVGAGVFKIVSVNRVTVTGDAQTTRTDFTADDKDGG